MERMELMREWMRGRVFVVKRKCMMKGGLENVVVEREG